eukprot:3491526-Pyramimonas_sp.AAC.1
MVTPRGFGGTRSLHGAALRLYMGGVRPNTRMLAIQRPISTVGHWVQEWLIREHDGSSPQQAVGVLNEPVAGLE